MDNRRRKYCCDASRLAYENYYIDQVGSGLPVYVGSRNQRGHGLGSVLGGLFRSAVPIVKKGLATLGKSALKTGLSIAGDVLEGKNAGEAARSRVAEGIKNLVTHEEPPIKKRQVTVEEVRLPKRQRRIQRKFNKRRRQGDIFD